MVKLFTTHTLFKFFEMLIGCYINPAAEIGEGLYIGHYGGIVIGPVKMGTNCNISIGNVIGVGKVGSAEEGVPQFGDSVYIGPSAKVFGKIKIGNNVAIGANAVVTKDLPGNAVAVGVPARIIDYNGSGPWIHNGVEALPEGLQWERNESGKSS